MGHRVLLEKKVKHIYIYNINIYNINEVIIQTQKYLILPKQAVL